jgi:VIT1/CCC1 family predicted Fe2+/Mn2+ transporter
VDGSKLLARRALQVQRGAARAAVLGVNDGLVSVLCLVLAVAGAGADAAAVLLAGFAGLLAGAISMAAGEWISVQAQVELFGGILKDVERLMLKNRQLLNDQIAGKLQDSGYNEATAIKATQELQRDDKLLRDTYAQQVMGFNPYELGSPWIAAFSSFVLFTLGALAPLAPWIFGGGTLAIVLSIALTGLASLLIGGFIGMSSGKGMVYGALRQLFIVVLASVVTYGTGYLFGVSVG